MKRAVLDTNTIISGLLSPKSQPGKILDARSFLEEFT
jgi:predicted nucleic acid-binding protein